MCSSLCWKIDVIGSWYYFVSAGKQDLIQMTTRRHVCGVYARTRVSCTWCGVSVLLLVFGASASVFGASACLRCFCFCLRCCCFCLRCFCLQCFGYLLLFITILSSSGLLSSVIYNIGPLASLHSTAPSSDRETQLQ